MPDFSLELSHGRHTGTLIAGIDEVGRGPLAGPVVAAAVIWPDDANPACERLWQMIDDSKKLTATKRAALADVIREHAICGIGEANVTEIDNLNILQASWLAMQRAVDQLSVAPAFCLVDGNYIAKTFTLPARAIVKGDSLSLSIAAASIIAKVHRDNMMAELAETYPQFGWARNAGYGTAQHMAALVAHGPTPYHRMSFAPVRAAAERTKAA